MGKGCNHEESMALARADAKLIIMLAAAASAGERRRIRMSIAPALKELRDAIGEQDRTGSPHQTRRLYGYVADIDRATRAPRKGRAR